MSKKTQSQGRKLSAKEMDKVQGGTNVKMSAFAKQPPRMAGMTGMTITITNPGVTITNPGVTITQR